MSESLNQEAARLLGEWCGSSGIFPSTDPLVALLPWLQFRIALTYREGGSLVDLGGGVSAATGVLARLGMQVTVVDMLDAYYVHSSLHSSVARQAEFLEKQGVRFVQRDLTQYLLTESFAPQSLDVVSSYHVLEHLHQSPRPLLHSAMTVLKPGGNLVVEVPNAVNLLKRAKVLLGRTNYLPYAGYYESERYYGHVREYCVSDLIHLARGTGLGSWRIEGRNWYGRLYQVVPSATLARLADRILQLRPGLCAALFLVGTK
jgi:2-polyprenyl-3-methyl-5-hydroxy-6-metoxy-1,4-benzoquinol methylase